MNIDTNTLRKFIAERMEFRSYMSEYGNAMMHIESFLDGYENELRQRSIAIENEMNAIVDGFKNEN